MRRFAKSSPVRRFEFVAEGCSAREIGPTAGTIAAVAVTASLAALLWYLIGLPMLKARVTTVTRRVDT